MLGAALGAVLMFVFTAACGGQDRAVASVTPPPAWGAVVTTVPLVEMDVNQVRGVLAEQGLDTSRVRYGVSARRVEYATVDPDGRPTTASALVTVPKTEVARPELVSWQHGTTVARADAGSMSADGSDRAAALFFAADGYVVSAPDYLGLGTGPGFHPYDHLPSTVTASVDSLRATRTLAERDGHRLDGRVLLTGHSQGGPAAMAVGRELAKGGSFRVAGLAPISGPHDYAGTLHTAVTSGIANGPAYMAYLTVAWNRLHHLYGTPSEAFRPPYDRTVEGLMDGSHGPREVMTAMPRTLEELFTPEFLAGLRRPGGALADALRVAGASCDWRPDVPVRVFASTGDRDVPIANATYCQRAVRAAGGQAEVIDLGAAVDHSDAFIQALPKVLAGFEPRS